MRTTLNLDPDVAERLGELAKARGTSLSRVANDLVRAGLRSEMTSAKAGPYEPPVLRTGRVRIDVTDVAEALEQLEDG